MELLAILLTLLVYLGVRRLSVRFPRVHPMILSAVAIWFIWWLISGDFEVYAKGGQWITFWLGPATVALAYPVAKEWQQLTSMWRSVLVAVAFGTGVVMISTWITMEMLQADPVLTRSILSKSVTMPIAIELSENIGGIPPLSALFTAITGIIGSVMMRPYLKALGITDDWAIGIAVGTSAHAIGTASLLRDSERQAAASSLAMILAGVITSLYYIPLHLLLG
ncbi:LrgB family protein [Brevibacillus dissolubilis]|uniref:LrgB family protein n=1 Tax=Brevibacillus dissolubilis TaxID=1844116 RepID=UPI0011161E86|nr:LrgB family protein [Brevibacillus dissolubilis]